jgi:hypothetical protein
LVYKGTGAGFSGGNTISTLRGSFSQDDPSRRSALIGPANCAGAIAAFNAFTDEFDIGAHPMDVVDGNIILSCNTNGTPAPQPLTGNCVTGGLSGTTFVQVHLGDGLAWFA